MAHNRRKYQFDTEKDASNYAAEIRQYQTPDAEVYITGPFLVEFKYNPFGPPIPVEPYWLLEVETYHG